MDVSESFQQLPNVLLSGNSPRAENDGRIVIRYRIESNIFRAEPFAINAMKAQILDTLPVDRSIAIRQKARRSQIRILTRDDRLHDSAYGGNGDAKRGCSNVVFAIALPVRLHQIDAWNLMLLRITKADGLPIPF